MATVEWGASGAVNGIASQRRRRTHALGAGQIAWSEPVPGATTSAINLTTSHGDEPSVVVVYGGRPIGEPVVMGGPFVMNSRTEIVQAYDDFRSGRFGSVPRQARLP